MSVNFLLMLEGLGILKFLRNTYTFSCRPGERGSPVSIIVALAAALVSVCFLPNSVLGF